MGVSVFYYLGRLETEKSPDGKRVCYSMRIGGYKQIPPARDPDLGRALDDLPHLVGTQPVFDVPRLRVGHASIPLPLVEEFGTA